MPHPEEAGGNVRRRCGFLCRPMRRLHSFVPALSVEIADNTIRYKAAPARVRMSITNLTLVKRVKPLRHDEVQFVLRPRHCDIQQPPFFFDLFRGAGRPVRRNAAIDDVQDPDDPPFLPLGRMDGGQDRVIFIEGICASPATRRAAGSRVSSVRNRSLDSYPAAICSNWAMSAIRK
jgi:hypothetical protein